MVIARVSGRIANGKDRTVRAAHKAEEDGWRNVHTGYDAKKKTYTVNADGPTQAAGGAR